MTVPLTLVGGGSDSTTIDGATALASFEAVFDVFGQPFTARAVTIRNGPLAAITGTGDVRVEDCVLRDNGFGVYLFGSTLEVVGGRLERNSHGAAQFVGTMRLSGVHVADNIGDGVSMVSPGGAELVDSVVERNGHGVFVGAGVGTVRRSTIRDNTSEGILVDPHDGSAEVHCEDSTIHGNDRGIELRGAHHGAVVTRCTIADNHTSGPGAGIL